MDLNEIGQDLSTLKSLVEELGNKLSDSGTENRLDRLMELLKGTTKQLDRSPALQRAAAKAHQRILALSDDVRRCASQADQKPSDELLALLDQIDQTLTTIRKEGGIDP